MSGDNIDIEVVEEKATSKPRYPEDLKEKIDDNVKLKVGVVGVGNAGSQIVEKLHREGYPTFVINSSYKDLQSSVVNTAIPSFIAGDEARGAGKDRNRAKDLFKVNGRELFKETEFTRLVDGSDIVIVVASTAGGTGSGIAPEMMSLFQKLYDNKIIIFYGIVPKLSDSARAHYNTIEALDEINKLGVPYLLADLSFYEDIPNDIAYDKIGTHVVFAINTIAGKYLNHSNSGMIDENDMRVIVSEPGYISVYALNDVKEKDIENKSVQKLLIEKVKRSPAVVTQHDYILKHLGVIVNCPSSMMEDTRTGNYNELTEYIGKPLTIFENYSVTNQSLGQFIAIVSGMNFPYSRSLESRRVLEEYESRNKNVEKADLTDDVATYKHLAESANISKDSRKKIDDGKLKSTLDDFFG